MGLCLSTIINIESKPILLNEPARTLLHMFRKVWSKLLSSSTPSWNNNRYCYWTLQNVSFMWMILLTFIWTMGQGNCFQVHHITTNLHYASTWRRQTNIAWNILLLGNIHYSFVYLQGQSHGRSEAYPGNTWHEAGIRSAVHCRALNSHTFTQFV